MGEGQVSSPFFRRLRRRVVAAISSQCTATDVGTVGPIFFFLSRFEVPVAVVGVAEDPSAFQALCDWETIRHEASRL